MTPTLAIRSGLAAGALALVAATATPALAKDKEEVKITKCETSHGTVAITDGDAQGWSKFGLSSPRGMIGAMVTESGCFTLQTDPGKPADYLISAVAGSQEEIDQSINVAKGVVTEGLLRTGALGQIASKVPFAGSLLGAFGGLGGKKKTISAGLRLVSPANGQTLIAGTGQSQKSIMKIMGASEWVATAQGAMGGYATSKDGQMVTSAFVEAYNALVAQAGALAVAQQAAAGAPTAQVSTEYTVAVDTGLMASGATGAARVRDVRKGTKLIPTGKRDGLFVEVKDSYGTQGWVSVEDLE
ncbi:MAG: SH3 domain-containing protein [Sphingomonadales bacterium]|nr:SH3 domain-containing protein [Sphingomonadales bacterium]